MDRQNFKLTFEALDALSNGVELLKQTIDARKNALLQQKESYRQNMAQKNNEIEHLKQIIADTVEKVGVCAATIDKVLNDNGSGNNSN